MYVVTGGAGFIGSNLVAALAARGEEVVVVDRLRQGVKWRNLAKHTIAALIAPEDLPAFLARRPPIRTLFHLGAITATTETDGDLIARVNIQLPAMLWEWCAEHRIPFLYASSAAVYGDGAQGFDDDLRPEALARLRPLNLYGWSKLAFDRRVAYILARGQPRPPHWAGLRFFNVYGPNEHHKGRMASVVLHKFNEIMRGEAATLFASDRPDIADGEQKRDFVHVRDCVAALLWLADHPEASGLYNLGTGQARSFLEVVQAIFAALGRPPAIRFVPMPQDLKGRYQYFTEARMERLRAAGFTHPPTPLEAGIRSYIQDVLLNAADPFA